MGVPAILHTLLDGLEVLLAITRSFTCNMQPSTMWSDLLHILLLY